MSTAKEHAAASKKLNAGPGGIKCVCCNPFRSKAKAKKLSSRVARRRSKMKGYDRLS